VVLCGEVRFQVSGKPEFCGVCHCRYCQLRTGSALAVLVYFQKGNVKITQGTLKSYKLINESDKEMDFQFCTTCGTTLLWDIELLLDLTGTAGGAYDPPTFWYSVDRELFQRSKADFVHIDSPESHYTSRLYDPTHTDDPRLKGG
jgi:hypothetical protein